MISFTRLLLHAAAHFHGSFRSSHPPGESRWGLLSPPELRHQLDGVVQILGFEHAESTQLLFRLGIRAIGNEHHAVSPSQGDGVASALERFAANNVALLPQQIIVSEAPVQEGVLLALRHRLQNGGAHRNPTPPRSGGS